MVDLFIKGRNLLDKSTNISEFERIAGKVRKSTGEGLVNDLFTELKDFGEKLV